MTRLQLALASCLVLLVARPAFAAGTPAGTIIPNTAQVTYTVGGSQVTTPSNTNTITVDERLDVVVTLQSPPLPVQGGDTRRGLLLRVTNIGNGDEVFSLAMTSAIAGDDFDPIPSIPAIYFDTDASGDLSAADTPYVAGSNDPLLVADAFVTVIVANDIPTGLVNGAIGRTRLTATSKTGAGPPGAIFAGLGKTGVNAVVGVSGGVANAVGVYVVSDVSLSNVKSATVQDPFGGSEPVPGARITYQIVVAATGTGTAANAVLDDPIPANTTFVAGSLRLNAVALSDAADADAGEFIAGASPAIRVRLGSLAAAAGNQTIVFQVTIN
ncbi:MAG TPA: hypothetical protein VE046_01005 [Steroidobacteraceae bacterium]|nr:hypothetical protein [Steroidobacteraceae bacterium]